MSMSILLRAWCQRPSQARERQGVDHAGADAATVATRKFHPGHPLRFGAGPGGISNLAVYRPEHQVDASLAPQAVWPLWNRVNNFDPVASGDLYRRRARRQQSRAPASIGADHGARTEWSAYAPVLAGQYLNEPLPPSLQRRFLEFGGRVLPVDLIND